VKKSRMKETGKPGEYMEENGKRGGCSRSGRCHSLPGREGSRARSGRCKRKKEEVKKSR